MAWRYVDQKHKLCTWVKNMKLSVSNSMEMTWNKTWNLHAWVPAWQKTTQSNANICTRIAKALSSFERLQNIWKNKEIPLTTKVKFLQTLVFPIICYVCEMWTLRADVTHRCEAFQMQCYHHLLNIKWQDHITNEEVLTWLGSFIKMRLLAMIRKCQAEWLSMWHICLQIGCQILPCLVTHQESFITVIILRDGLNLNLEGAVRTAQDRIHWKTIIRGPNVI